MCFLPSLFKHNDGVGLLQVDCDHIQDADWSRSSILDVPMAINSHDPNNCEVCHHLRNDKYGGGPFCFAELEMYSENDAAHGNE
jgi:hypothetical protein